YPFKSYQKNIGLDDGDDDFIDIDDDVEDEIVDAEQASRSVELSDNGQPNENNDVSVSLNDDILSPVPPTNLLDEDEFISDDDDSNDSSVDLPASNDNEKNQLLDVLRKSHGLLLRTRKMVKIMRNVSSIDQYVRNHEHGPCNGFVIDIRTRWSSTFHMLKRLIHYQEIVKSVFIHKFPSINGEQRSSLAKVYIDHENWDLLQALQDVASYLDPESHKNLSREDKQAAKAILPNFMKMEAQSIVGSSTSTSSSATKSNQTLTDKLKMMVGMSTNVKPSRSLSPEDELILFTQVIQSFKCDFSSFWIQYREHFSCLYKVAQRVNIITATSVPSESIFSIAGYVARKQRTSLSSTSLRHLMVLKESHRIDALRTISRGDMC
ncbi:unnamed protein product, partial [Rotaria socialis]